MLYYVYFSNAGVPATGLAPTWHALKTDSGTNASDNPTISEVGGGWYQFAITFGADAGPWKTTGDVITHDLLGVIDGDPAGTAGLADIDRYKPVAITKRGLALALLAHKAVQAKATGDVVVYATDDATAEATLDMTDGATTITRALADAS